MRSQLKDDHELKRAYFTMVSFCCQLGSPKVYRYEPAFGFRIGGIHSYPDKRVGVEVGYTIIMPAFVKKPYDRNCTKRLVQCKHGDQNVPSASQRLTRP